MPLHCAGVIPIHVAVCSAFFNLVSYMLSVVRNVVKKMVGPVNQGRLRYRINGIHEAFGGSFNGQQDRRAIFKGALERCQPKAIIETGTYWGSTTQYMAESTTIPIFTVEYNPLDYGTSLERLRPFKHVKVFQGDSRDFLRKIFASGQLPSGPILYYLDAHWEEELPLAEEITLIYDRHKDGIIIVDDFQVPWDEGYTYDDYGPGKALTPEYIAPLVAKYNLAVFYPGGPSSEETGRKRGCVVMTGDPALAEKLATIPELRRA